MGSGIILYEMGTADLGLAAAGYAARAEDASTLFTNPAGMSRLGEAQFTGGAHLLFGSIEFSKDPNLTGPLLRGDGDGGNSLGVLPAASAFFVQPLSEKVAVGLGTFSYFGLLSQYDDDWVGRYYVQEGALLGLSIMPAVSVKLSDWLSIGAGLNAMFGYFDTEVAIRTGAPGDGQLKLKDNTWGFGANAGVLVEPRQGTRLGLTYLSPVDLDFADTPGFSNLGPLAGLPVFSRPPKLDLGITVPQSIMFSVRQQLHSSWALLANVGWQNWDDFGKVDVGVDSANPTDLTADLNYQDTWHVALGVEYHAAEDWLFTGGFAYDSSPVEDEDRTFSLPMGETWRIGVGARWQVKPGIELGAACEFGWMGDLPVLQESTYRGTVGGAYEDVWLSFVAINLNWRF
jgi:long-chain fatty acid transport protein